MKNFILIVCFILPTIIWAQEHELPMPPPEVEEPEPVQEVIYDFPDVQPSFPGGDAEMMKFITKNIKYPAMDRENNIQGKVYIRFVVEPEGTITNIKIMRGVSKTIDAEAIRVVKLMPKWIPGQVKGKNIRAIYTIPISFRLG